MLTVRVLLLGLAVAMTGGCGGGNDEPEGTYELWIDDDYLSVIELTFLKGRCVARANIDSQAPDAEAALLAFGRYAAGEIALDGSSPATDDQLLGLIPATPLTGDLADWQSSAGGAWLVTTTAFDWINGSGPPFEDNGFEAVAGDSYQHQSQSWALDLEVVNMGDAVGAEAAFRAAGWDSGSQRD